VICVLKAQGMCYCKDITVLPSENCNFIQGVVVEQFKRAQIKLLEKEELALLYPWLYPILNDEGSSVRAVLLP